MRITFHDARKGVRELDVTRRRGGGARRQGPRGRPPRAASEERQPGLDGTGFGPSRLFPHVPDSPRREPSGPGSTMGRWGLTLLAGPANAGKVALLLDRYLDGARATSRADRAERGRTSSASSATCCAQRPALLGGSIGTFDDLFRRLAPRRERPVDGDAQRALRPPPRGRDGAGSTASRRSARFGGLRRRAPRGGRASSRRPARARRARGRPRCAVRRLPRGARAARPRDRELLRAPRPSERLDDRLRGLARRARLRVRLRGPDRRGVGLLEALAGRADVTVSLPYEPGRARSRRCSARPTTSPGSRGRIEELPPRYAEIAQPALAHLERRALRGRPRGRAAARGRRPLLRGRRRARRARARRRGGPRARARRHGAGADRASSARRSSAGARRSRRRSATLGIPYALEGARPAAADAVRRGAARAAPLRVARRRRGATSSRFLRSPYSGLAARERRLPRGAAARPRDRRRPSASRRRPEGLRGGEPCRRSSALRGGREPVAAVRALAAAMLRRRATDSRRRRSASDSRGDLRALRGGRRRLLDELDGWAGARRRALARGRRRGARAGDGARARRAGEPGRVAVLDLLARPHAALRGRVRARPRGGQPAAARRRVAVPRRRRAPASSAARLARGPTRSSRDRYLFYTACTRATRRLDARPRGGDRRGQPARAEPVLGRGRGALPARGRRALRRAAAPLSALTWPLEAAPTERERLRALAPLAADRAGDDADALARANGWERRLDRALAAFDRPHAAPASARPRRARRPRRRFNVTELERFADCSSAWFVDRVARPEDDRRARSTRSCAARSRTRRCTASSPACPKELGSRPRRRRSSSTTALAFLRRVPRAARRGRADGADASSSAASSSEGLWRDLEAFVRAEAASRARRSSRAASRSRSAPSARRRSSSAASTSATGSRSPGRSTGSTSTRSARAGSSQDYKSRQDRALGARRSSRSSGSRSRSTCSCCATSSAIEPLGGLYRPLAGERKPRGLLAPRRRTTASRASRGTTTSTRTRSGRRSRRRAAPARELAQRIRAATCGTTRGAAAARVVRPLADVPGEAGLRRVALNAEQQAAAIDAPRPGLRLRRRGHGEDDGARRALRARGLRRGPRRRLDPRDHVHEARGRRAARAASARGSSSAAGTTSRASSTAPGSRRSTASATAC